MSYINKQGAALVRVKLTDVGRHLLALGQLTFSKYVIGDSEVDYDYVKGWYPILPQVASNGEFLFEEANGNVIHNIFSKVLRPKDKQPFLSTFLINQSNEHIFPLNLQSNIQLITGTVSNEAADRGFFSGSTVAEGLTAVTTTQFIKESGTVDLVRFDGGIDVSGYTQGVITLDTPLSATSANDYIMFRLSNCTLGNVIGDAMTAATINTFYNIVSISGSTIHVDRILPTLSGCAGTVITYYTFPGGDDPMDTYYGLPSLSAYWNTGTLSFANSCDICIENIPVWNMNNVWTENPSGLFTDTTGSNYHSHNTFGSEQYAGSKQFLGYNEVLSSTNNSYIDTYQKSISLIHYTNSCISNFYGEMFYIDEDTNKLTNLDIPVLWHRRGEGTGSGTTLGMTFVSDTIEKELPLSVNDTIKYYDLIEFSGMSITPLTPLSVGKVFPDLKMVVIDNEELLAAMSYKSNRNYTLPDLEADLITSTNGNCTGCLKAGETMFLTYWLSNTGTTTSATTTPVLPCQRYRVIENNTNSDKDLQFNIENVGELPYMRKIEDAGYDGLGFFADNFNIICQVVPTTTPSTRPAPNKWKILTGFTTPLITGVAGETIDPILLETQSPQAANFIITGALYSGATIFNLGDELDMASGNFYGKMTFGDERLFYGNLRTYIGATIYKTLFNINVDGNTLSSTTNPTYDGTDRYITEIGILDNNTNPNLVLVGKLSRPIKLSDASTASIELTIDF